MIENSITKYSLPFSLAVVAAAAAAGILGYHYAFISQKSAYKSQYREIPTAKGSVPYFGHLLAYLFTREIPAILMMRQNDMQPILRVDMGCRPWIIISDRDIAHEVLNGHGAATSHRPRHTYERLQSAEHGLVFSSPSNRWRKIRAAVTQLLSPKHLDTVTKMLETESRCVVDRLLMNSSTSASVGVLRELKLFTMNMALMLGFGYRIERPDDPLFDTLLKLIEVSIVHADPMYDRRAFLPVLMGAIDWCSQKEKMLTSYIAEVRDPLMQQLIRHGLHAEKECLAKKLDEMRDDDIDDRTILGTCFDLVVAGTDTASTTLAWAMVILCNHPDVQSKLQAEIDAFAEAYGRLPSFEERLDHLPLLISVQKECMRMRPISPFGLSRHVVADVVCRDYLIPKGVTLCANIFAIHHDPNVYPEPYQFKADRFLNKPRPMSTLAKASVEERDQFAFGMGRRICPGAYLGELEMFHVWVRLLACATIEPPIDNDGKAVHPDIHAIANGGGVIFPAQDNLRVVRRSNPLNL